MAAWGNSNVEVVYFARSRCQCKRWEIWFDTVAPCRHRRS
jgi:hypothetical protein